MKLFIKYIILLLFLTGTKTVLAQQVLVKGYVMSIDSSKVVPLANVLNKTTAQRFIGSRQGLFKAKLSPSDSITITAIGYEAIILAAKDIFPENSEDTIQVFMRPKSYQLKDVTIIYGNKRRDSIAQIVAEILKTDPLMNNYSRILNRNEGGLSSPLTAMWNEYSKAGQDMKKFEEFMQHAEMLKQVNMRYNKKAIKRATGLDEAYLDEYILFCNIDRAFVLNSSDYDLILSMRECLHRFKLKKGID